MGRGDKVAQILDLCRRAPYLTNQQVSEQTGAQASYVSIVRTKHGLKRQDLAPEHLLSDENRDWALLECEEHGLTVVEFINACLTDARLDQEEEEAEGAYPVCGG